MKIKQLDAKKKGEYKYDYKNDILLFKTKGRDYLKSLDFGNLVIDIDRENFITGLRIFDASKVFDLSKLALNNVKNFDFKSKVESKVITIQLKFTSVLRNRPMIKQGQNFVWEAAKANICDSEVVCSI